jgi:hypothetical protein
VVGEHRTKNLQVKGNKDDELGQAVPVRVVMPTFQWRRMRFISLCEVTLVLKCVIHDWLIESTAEHAEGSRGSALPDTVEECSNIEGGRDERVDDCHS